MIEPPVAATAASDAFAPSPPGTRLGAARAAVGHNPFAAELRRALARGPGPASRLHGGEMLALLALLGLVAIVATDQIVPATSAHQAQVRVWLASRAAGVVALVLLTAQIVIGLLVSHPTNKATWRVSPGVFPWHDSLWLFVLAFVVAHVVSIVVDPYAGVGLVGAIVPGLSSYRSAPVALGSLALYALLIVGLTARFTRLLPRGAWLVIHRAGVGVFVLGWMHGLLAGTDSPGLFALYVALGSAVAIATAWRWWGRARSDIGTIDSAADLITSVPARSPRP